MVRLSAAASALLLLASPAWSQQANLTLLPPPASTEQAPAFDFSLPDDPDGKAPGNRGSNIVAGTEVSPNGMVGFGIFGEKSGELAQPPVTNRDYTLGRQRKPAVGFSLKF